MSGLLLRGMLVGIVAGLLAFAFARAFGEPQVDRAIVYEERAAVASESAGATADSGPEPELVSRATQAGTGLAIALLAYGAAIGGLFSLVFAAVHGRVGRVDARVTSALLALAAFVCIVLVPQLTYPANPPAVGSDETIGLRTGMFFFVLALSIAAMALSVSLARGLRARHGPWNAALIGAAAFVLYVVVIQLATPHITEVPDDFPADVLWNFRVASIGMHVILWSVIGLVFGPVAARLLGEGASGRRPAASSA